MLYVQINVKRQTWGEPVDMSAIIAALEAANLDIDTEERAQGGESEEAPEYIFVDSCDKAKAVKIINGFGYKTDEDPETEEA